MKYVLNLADDGRVLSAGIYADPPAGAVTVESLPGGNLNDYRYTDGAFVHDPLPAAAAVPTDQDRLAAQVTYTAMMTDTLLDETGV